MEVVGEEGEGEVLPHYSHQVVEVGVLHLREEEVEVLLRLH